jgi:hypothetical protein
VGEYRRDAVVVVNDFLLYVVLQFLFGIGNCGKTSAVCNRTFYFVIVIITGIVSFLMISM